MADLDPSEVRRLVRDAVERALGPDAAPAVGPAARPSGAAARRVAIGSTMAANKVPGVRCALCHDDATARNSREHNDANMLALGSRVVNRGLAQRLVRLFLATPFGGGRHERRVHKIMALDRGPAEGA